MKFFVVALSLVAICSAFTADEISKDDKYTQECNAALGITKEESDKFERDVEKFLDDTKAQDSVKCFLKKYNFFDENGDFQESAAIETFTKGEVVLLHEAELKQCVATAGDTKANGFAIKFYACCEAAGKALYKVQ